MKNFRTLNPSNIFSRRILYWKIYKNNELIFGLDKLKAPYEFNWISVKTETINNNGKFMKLQVNLSEVLDAETMIKICDANKFVIGNDNIETMLVFNDCKIDTYIDSKLETQIIIEASNDNGFPYTLLSDIKWIKPKPKGFLRCLATN